jgi:Phage tail tube protein
MALPKVRSFVGVAKEASRPTNGTAPTAAVATDYIPVSSITPFDNIAYLDDMGMRGSMVDVYNVIPGRTYSEFEIAGDVFADTIGYLAAGLLGDVTTSGASAPYTHAISTLNSGTGQPTTYTFTDYNALNARLFAGAQMQSLDTKFSSDALLTYSAKAMGYASAVGSTPTPSFSAVTPTPVWTGVVTIAGGSNIKLAEGNIGISRTVEPIFTVIDAQRPYQVFAGPVKVEGSFTFVTESDAELDYYLNNTQPIVVVDFTQGASSTLTQVQFTMSDCAFTVGKIERSKDYVETNVTYKAIANTTDAGASLGFSPIKIQLKNAKASGTYV